jgi:hypothetical protein
MRTRHFLFPLLLLGLAACAPPQKYYWGDYTNSLHSYYVDPKAETNYQKALADVTSAEAKGKKVPPGLYAEYGYEALAHGDVEKAVEMFEHEKRTWPESTVFMDKAIAAARTGRKPDAPNAPSPQANLPTS